MKTRRLIEKLEHDLSNFLVAEMCKLDPEKVASPEAFRFKGLNITPSYVEGTQEKTISVRIGGLEADFSIGTYEKISGSLPTEDEKNIILWLKRRENVYDLRLIFDKDKMRRQAAIIPFDLEEPYYRGLL